MPLSEEPGSLADSETQRSGCKLALTGSSALTLDCAGRDVGHAGEFVLLWRRLLGSCRWI